MINTMRQLLYHGSITAPASKSFIQRALAIATLCKGKTIIQNPAFCDDTSSALKMSEALGADISVSRNIIEIQGNLKPIRHILSAGESGLGIRMFATIASLLNHEIKLTGEGSLRLRPIHMIEESLKQLGVVIKSNEGLLPITVCGPLKGGKAIVDGSISSQVLTGLLIALPLTNDDSTLEVKNLNSKPYIDLTLKVMSEFGINIDNEDYSTFHIKGNQSCNSCRYTIEGDWSGASFHLVGGAISGDVIISGLNTTSLQSDRKIISALSIAGATIQADYNSVQVIKNQLKAFEFDATHCPDLFPPLVVLAASCIGTSQITGVSRLQHKESNRALVLKNEFEKIGVEIIIDNDSMLISGGKITGGEINSNNDHRIAMAGSIAGLISNTPVKVCQPEAINKSYPGFYNDFNKLLVR
jgi:3-phosphoshikimate 1-carboxyvinyltransferase